MDRELLDDALHDVLRSLDRPLAQTLVPREQLLDRAVVALQRGYRVLRLLRWHCPLLGMGSFRPYPEATAPNGLRDRTDR